MKFIDLLKESSINESKNNDYLSIEESEIKDTANKQKNNKLPEELLRSSGYKIKLITPTSFGVQIDFAKKYEEKDIKNILKEYNIKIKDKSVFIVY